MILGGTMPEDKLARFRNLPSDNEAQKSADAYSAFGTKDKVRRLRIRSAMEPTVAVRNDLLLTVTYDGSFGTNFVLLYTVLIVLVRGKNLQKLIYALENDMADYIQQFDPDLWDKPTDTNAAFIESIEIKVVGGDSSPIEEITKH
jgi:hypothetical protein